MQKANEKEYQLEQQQRRAHEGKAYGLKPGHKWNKLMGYPRNAPCICGSGNKFKKCCINLVSQTVPNGQKQWEELSDAEKQDLKQQEKEAMKNEDC